MGKRKRQIFLNADPSAASRNSIGVVSTTIIVLACGCMHHAVMLYAGPLRPVAGACNPVTRAELTVKGDDVLFIPFSGTVVLRGSRTGNLLTARNASTGADRKPYDLDFTGHLSDGTVTGTYQTPRCRYDTILRPTSG